MKAGNWLVEVFSEEGYFVYTQAFATLAAATKEMNVQLSNDPYADATVTLVTGAMEDFWAQAWLEHADARH